MGGRVQVSFGTAWNASGYASQNSAGSHYRGVTQQSSLLAGDGGFQIDVGGTTSLTGAVIASTADPSLNWLSTEHLTVSDLQNETSAKASSTNVWASSDMFSGSKYEAAKGIAGNLMGSASEGAAGDSVSRSDIAAGTVIVRNGDDVALARLDRTVTDLDGANVLEQIDVRKLQDDVSADLIASRLVYDAAVKFTDQAHIADFVGRVIGSNPATGGTLPEGSSWFEEIRRTFGGANTVHSCYGATSSELCHQLWKTSPGGGWVQIWSKYSEGRWWIRSGRRQSVIIRSLMVVLVMSLLVLMSCAESKPFQPPPPVYKQWKKTGSSEFDVKKNMLECGYPTPFGEYGNNVFEVDIKTGDVILMHKCMRALGYRYDDGVNKDYDICLMGRASEPECVNNIVAPAPSERTRMNSPYCKKYSHVDVCR